MSILILAGDLTNYYLYKKLKNNDYNVKLEGFSHLTEKYQPKAIKLAGFKTIIAPIPFTIDSSTLYSPYSEESVYIDQLLLNADKDSKIIGGPFFINDKRLYDITKNKSFTDKTVIPTCEEIIKIIIDNTDITITGSTILIAGEGRISNKLSILLKAFGAIVSIADDKSVEMCDVLVITNIKNNLSNNILKNLENKLIIDITNMRHSKEINKKVLKARGLPGKSAPSSVANYLFESLINNKLI